MSRWFVAVVGTLALVCGCASSSSDDSDSANEELRSSGSSHGSCTSNFGNGLSGSNGRLDGTVYAVVVPQNTHACNADKDHVHVQIQAQGQVYDVAVNTDGVGMVEKDVADPSTLPGGKWQEGWHRGASLSYTSNLGLHASDFGQIRDASQEFENDITNATQVSVYAWLYNKGGIHLVHKSRSSNADGAFVVQTSGGAKVYAFRFGNQSF